MRYLVIFLLIALAFSKKLDPHRIIYAIDAGNSQGGRSAQGFTYRPVDSELATKSNLFP